MNDEWLPAFAKLTPRREPEEDDPLQLGDGALSLDGLFGLTPFWTPETGLAAIAVGVIGAVANLAARRPAPVEA